VPDDDIARLMYYLNCVTISLGLDILHDDLVDYQNYHRLSSVRIALVFKSAVEFSPDIFLNKLIFKDDEGDIVPAGSSNKFVNITTACDIVSIQRDFVIGGQVKDVTKVMFFKTSWLNTFYNGPIERIAKAVLAASTKHCQHCEGETGMCACSTCPRTSSSKCRPVFESLFDALLSAAATPSSSTSRARSRSPAPSPKSTARPQHQANCDGCMWQLFTGPRYKCNDCYDFDLCEPCYKANKHIDTRHSFRKYEYPEASPIYLAPRTAQPAAPPPPYAEATRSTSTANSNPTPTRRVPPQPGPPMPKDEKTPIPSQSYDPNTLFYLNMSIAQLKNFLTERDVDATDIFDKETLCKRVWETHCDSMSISELNTFLSKNGISTAGCRDISARRQKAREAYRPPSRPAPSTPGNGSGGWRKDDVVMLTGLSKAEMNGKKALIQIVDTSQGKATVWVEDMGKAFKVKFENMKPFVANGDGSDVEELS